MSSGSAALHTSAPHYQAVQVGVEIDNAHLHCLLFSPSFRTQRCSSILCLRRCWSECLLAAYGCPDTLAHRLPTANPSKHSSAHTTTHSEESTKTSELECHNCFLQVCKHFEGSTRCWNHEAKAKQESQWYV